MIMEVTAMEKTNEQLIVQVSHNTILGNIALTIFKMSAGILGNSAAMFSDGIHSLSDVISTFIVIIGVRLANQEADKEHPYGHERFECVTAILLSAILCATGIAIGYSGIKTILSGHYGDIKIPGTVALAAAIVSIVVKEAMYWYTRAAAIRTKSGSLMADAWHHRSDALSSIGSFIGILAAKSGYPVLDAAVCLVICGFIVKVSVDIFRDAIKKMIDHACDDELIEQIRQLILSQEDVLDIDQLKTRMFGSKIYVDVEIRADRSQPLHISHFIAHSVHDSIEQEFPDVKHCMVHVNPTEHEEDNESTGI